MYLLAICIFAHFKTGVLVFYYCDQIAGKITLKEEGFILAHGFRGLSPWSAGHIVLHLYMVEKSCLPHGSQEAERERTQEEEAP